MECEPGELQFPRERYSDVVVATSGSGCINALLFNSLDSLTNYQPFGRKWSFEYASYLLITPGGQIQVRDGDGRLETFTAGSTAGIYPVSHTAPAGDFRTLVETADHVFTLTHQNGTVYHYGVPAAMAGTSSVPLLLSIQDKHGNSVSVTHNAQGAVTAVGHSMLPASTPSGGGAPVNRTWTFTYGIFDGNNRVTRIDDPFGRAATFDYNNDDATNPGRNLRNQTDMGGLAYGYDYTTKLSQNAVDPDRTKTTFAAATNELFISAIRTPKGTTAILTEPSNGIIGSPVSPGEAALGYSYYYPPIGSPNMWTNYRIRVTNPENKIEEYFFDGNTVTGYHRNPVQLNRPSGQSVAPTTGARVRYNYTLVGGVKGKIDVLMVYAPDGSLQYPDSKTYSATLLKRTAQRDPAGNWTSYEFNTNGTLKTLILPKAGSYSLDSYKIHHAYESNGLDPDKITRYLDNTLKTLLDIDYWPGTRDVKQTTDALGRVTGYVWHPNGLPVSVTDATTGDVVTFIYDQGVSDGDGYPTWRLLKVFNGSESTGILLSETGYDEVGRPAMVTDTAADFMQFDYDGLNRLIRTESSDSSFSEQIWECCHIGESRSGMMVGGQDRLTNRTKYYHDRRGLLVKSIDTAGKITRFEYDDASRLTKLTDPLDRITQWTYDGFGRKDKKIYQDATYEQTIWDNMVEPYKIRNRRGQETTLDFDANGNLKTIVGTGVNILRQYDGWDRLKNLYDFNYNSTAHVFDYDDAGRVTSLNGPWSDDTLAWQYLDSQRKVIRTSPGGVTETTVTDNLGRIDSIANSLGTFTPGYDGDTSRLLEVIHSGGFDTAFTHYGSDLDRALHTIASKLPGGSVIAAHTYGYDDQNRINSWTREATLTNPSGPTRSFQWTSYYDFASQLTSVSEKSLAGTLQGGWDYAYDLAGNITTEQSASGIASPAALTKRSHNSLNQITSTGGGGPTLVRGTLSEPGQASVGLTGSGDKPARMLEGNRFETELPLQTGSNSLTIAASDFSGNRSDYNFTVHVAAQSIRNFSYDDDGNLTSDGVRSYEWDILSRLTKITWATGKTTEFKYNALGQRCDRIDTDGSTVTKRYHLYDGIKKVDRRSGTAASTATIDRRYFNQGEQCKNGSNWENYHYCRDHLGSIREVVKSDGSTNSLVARYDYDPYGKRLPQHEVSGYSCDFGYTGHDTIPSLESGQSEMVLTLFRAYDPALGRWLSADPLGEAGGMNIYAYCYGNPLNLYDPNGLYPEWAPGSDSYSWDSYWSDVGQVFQGEAKGAAENLSFGLYKPCYENDMERGGGVIGDYAVTAAQLATGAGALKAGARQATKQAGKEFSHWVPDRFFKNPTRYFGAGSVRGKILQSRAGSWFNRSMFNGNMVTAARHFAHDSKRFPSGWRDFGERLHPILQQIDRVPNSISGAAAGFGYAAGSHAARSGVECP